MAAQIVSRGKGRARPPTPQREHVELDRDDELLAAMQHEDRESMGLKPANGPLVISTDALMGKMPKADRILRQNVLLKLTSTFEWKPMDVALTTVGLFMARPNEGLLRDLIPLYEIVEVRKRHDISDYELPQQQDSKTLTPQKQASMRNIKMSNLLEMPESITVRHIVQVRTVDGGYSIALIFPSLNSHR